jgi:hypothetical protein
MREVSEGEANTRAHASPTAASHRLRRGGGGSALRSEDSRALVGRGSSNDRGGAKRSEREPAPATEKVEHQIELRRA